MEETKNELNLGKVTAKFAIKFILWAILFFVIGAVIVLVAFSNGIESVDEDSIEEMVDALNGLVYGLAVVDVIAALLATKLSVGGITKKNTITEENRPLILKRIGIVCVVVAIILLIVHGCIIGLVEKYIVEETDADSFSELIEDIEEYSDDLGFYDDDEIEEGIDALKSMKTAGNIYTVVGLVYAAMIPVANVLLKKKIESK